MRRITAPNAPTGATQAAGAGGFAWIDGVTYLTDAPAAGSDPHATTVDALTRAGYVVTEGVTPPAKWGEVVEALRGPSSAHQLAQLALAD
ncbi:hypothetical protein ABKW28_22400 [Nocardioides sp. 31GB23]|uniref:hypothetical protein n=1 Tax=Nocardioides sp. 31GB23 TaxID=3156065 RepID=UPI0032AF1456